MNSDKKRRSIGGIDLKTVLEASGPLHVSVACAIAFQIARALESLHQQQLVHRDVNPSNIIVNKEENVPKVILIDFGAAEMATHPITDHTAFHGIRNYASPESISRDKQIGLKTDVYSLGAILLAMIAGEPEKAGDWPTIAKDLQERSDVDTHLARLIGAMISTSPELRPTASEVAHKLKKFAKESDLEALSSQFELKSNPDFGEQPELEFLLDPGTASTDEIAELYYEISKLYRLAGGRGIQFTVADARQPEFAEDLQ